MWINVANNKCSKNGFILNYYVSILFIILLSANIRTALGFFPSGSSCDRTRKILTNSNGEITDGVNSNYTQDSHCEWLIKADNKSQFITLKFHSIRTECSYDYVFVYDGNSYRSPLLGSFSGKSERLDNIVATSGYMLILLYSDTNYVLDGFKAEYTISNCRNNCSNQGICVNHTCICNGNWTGKDCSYSPCPENCGRSEGHGVCNKNVCECSEGYSGRDCSLHKFKPVSNKWHWLSGNMEGLVARAAHTAVYNEFTDSLYVFGGYNLNNALDMLQIYRFATNSWENENGQVLSSEYEKIDSNFLTSALHERENKYLGIDSRASFLRNLLFTYPSFNAKSTENQNYTKNTNDSGPAARYGHSAAALKDGFVIFGGKLENSSFSNDLWTYNISENVKWKQRAQYSKLYPPKLTRHTLTLVNDTLYLFGGSLESGEFSSRLFRIKLSTNESEEQWEEINPRGGKTLDIRVVAHTTTYYSPTNSLIVYGGISSGVARFSKLSDRMFAFQLDKLHWTEINYPRSSQRDSYIPRERAFHTTSIIGNYLVVFGGYSHKHNREEICYDNHIFLYHLGCNIWVNQDMLGSNDRSKYPKNQGVFSHAAAIRRNHTLLLVGGYHGIVNNDLLAYTLPSMLTMPGYDDFYPEHLCPKHLTQKACISDPECGWCSADSTCYGRTIANCTTNLQTTRCPGLCPALGDCRSCLIHGSPNVEIKNNLSVANKLRLGHCTWCVHNTKCHHKDDNYACGEHEKGWWGSKKIEISDDTMQCTVLDQTPGLTFLKYLHPVDWNYPDHVSIVNSTLININIPLAEQSINGEIIARLLGYVRTPTSWKISGELLKVCAKLAQVTLKIGIDNPYTANILAANLTTDQYQCILSQWQKSEKSKILIDLQAVRKVIPVPGVNNAYPQASEVSLQLSKGSEITRALTFEYLEPYSNKSCHLFNNCLHCLSNNCGWCDITESCISRDNAADNIVCAQNNSWKYLILQPHQCTNCSNFITCDQCINHKCEWWTEDAKCSRKGRLKAAIKEVSECPTPCYLRKNCSTCLNEKGRCVWCESTSECFSFSVYTSQYQFGICREWLDKALPGNFSSMEGNSTSLMIDNQKCKSCAHFKNCTTCLKSLNCGWCYFKNNPIIGACVQGDFNSSNIDCDSVLNSTNEVTLFSYDQCPDVNECELGIHDCHNNSICTNTHGSFSCQCKKGFIGDGRHKCDKTCFENCKHGKCSNAPDYICECNLGWTGPDCSENCGCNNHSTCNERIGKCDYCQSWTYTSGEFCEFCITGSFGDATKNGCSQCDCNAHGNVSRGICDIKSGQCFCQDNTVGMNCERCSPQYYGDPRNGGSCYLQCESRAILKNVHRQGIGSYQSAADTRECLWILTLDEELQNSGAIIHLEIEKEHMNVSCDSNAIWIFNGIPEFTNNSQQRQLSNIFCNENNSPWIVEESRTNQLAVYYKQGIQGHGFNAIITIYSCKYRNCYFPYICDSNQRCVCPPGYTGERCSLQICPNNCHNNLTQGICDETYGRCICNEGFGDSDCSKKTNISAVILQELFNTQLVSEQFEHLKTQIPRFGHTLVIDRRGSLWMFGGFSLSHGALNDIRQFDTKNNTWMQVTVDSTPDAKMPQGRYFHASTIVLSSQTIYIYGGLNIDNKNKTVYFLNDFWEFNIQNQRWKEVDLENDSSLPIPLAGHTLTLVKDTEKESLVLIGGCSNDTHFELNNGIWIFDLQNRKWNKISTFGPMPVGIFGHSTTYHSSSQVLYIFGGYQITDHKMQISNKLFAFHMIKLEWSEIPVFTELNRPEENLPRGRFLHSAVSTDQYMIIYGGQTQPHNASDFLNAYVYRCNSWVRLTEDITMIGKMPSPTYGQAMVIDGESGFIYVAGGKDNLNYKITKIKLPTDLCEFWSSSKYLCRRMMGCGFCTISTNTSKTLRCFNNEISKTCETSAGSVTVGLGTECSSYISQRNCSEMHSCTACLATFFSHAEKNQVCQWCGEEDDGKCIEGKHKCGTSKIIGLVNQCSSIHCSAFDCNSCISRSGCNWAMIDENYRCVDNETVVQKNLEVMMTCPKKCDEYFDCSTCLNATSTEGGYMDCLWSTRLNKCISPSYQSLYCAGGICGLVISPENQDECPQSCESFQQCSKCLQNAHCGWCSTEKDGDGVCIEGSLDKPDKNVLQSTCNQKYSSIKNITKSNYKFSWNYVNCPPENECANNHHNCNPKSEKCIDLMYGFRCDCSDGYKMSLVNSKCTPECHDGCVRGVCLEPNYCSCDFGYVGKNCSIQCNCNGHSNCGGPDKLDECLECHNNTMGNQCEKCKPLFVGDPKNNKNCISCKDYCNGHSEVCVAKDMIDEARNISRLELESKLVEGPKTDAICLDCQNNTDGNQCDTCISGYFRGTSTLAFSCRPCECGGHGNMCDAVTGEKCNCSNNTESDNTCSTKKNSVKNSIYLCWMSQCSKCKESYSGHPKNYGHQCYKHITIDSKFCLDARTLDECRAKPKPLRGGQSVFFVVQPRFMNVDIRIILDVTQGELDFFMSANDDSFVIINNQSTNFHEVFLNSKYNWVQDMNDFDFIENLNIYPFNVTLNKKPNNLDENVSMPQSFIDDRHANGGGVDCKNSYPKGFYVKDLMASDLSTYVTLDQCNTLIRVYKLKNRLVLTLPQNIHNLSATRFFIALRASSNVVATYGMIFFRQDQLHIDLFVFFSVFFSCFFLFLATCVMMWKAKQAADARRARRRQIVEMLHMAQRPFSTIILDTTFEDFHNQSRKRSNNAKSRNAQSHYKKNYVPLTFETTADNLAGVCTLFIRLPGLPGRKSNLCLGSSLVAMPKNNIFLKPSLRHLQQMQQQQIF